MSLKETLSLAHTAQCKLHIAANRPDRNLRFVLGHALTLDNLSLRLVEIEEEQAAVQQPKHASGVKFKAAGNGSSGRRRSPPPSRLSHAVDPDEEDEGEDVDDNDDESDSDQDELALTRFPSGSARPPQQPPPLVPSDDDSDEEDDPPSPPPLTDEELRRIVNSKGSDSDELLTSLYKGIKGCSCHGKTDTVPDVQQLWEVPAQDNKGPRFAVAEIAPPVAA